MQHQVTFPSGTVNYFPAHSVNELGALDGAENVIVITDSNLVELYPQVFEQWRTLVVTAGEASKSIETITSLSEQLMAMGATRQSMLVGIGGGVVTDITGFLASVFMRGVKFGFVPTSLLAMVDASIGGKNGVNLGLHKNMLGTFRQPEFILTDNNFLDTLPEKEWSNGFAEIIKYACIFDAELFADLANNTPHSMRSNRELLGSTIARCISWKNKTVLEDEQEKGIRKLLNFGHTAGHAIETLYGRSHGEAVGVGMVIACRLSETYCGLNPNTTNGLCRLLQVYGLPVTVPINVQDVISVISGDKKRKGDTIDYVSLKELGEGVIYPLPLTSIETALSAYESNN